jgi:hypothetical protein
MRKSCMLSAGCWATLAIGSFLMLPGCGDSQGPASQGPAMTSAVPKNNPTMEEAIKKNAAAYQGKKGGATKQTPGAPLPGAK